MTTVGGYIGIIGALALAVMAFIRIFLMRQITDLRDDVDRLTTQMAALEAKYDEERGLKHKAYNDVARAAMALDLVRRLAAQCTCGVLEPLIEIVDRMASEFETMTHRRHGDRPEGDTP